MWLLPVTCFMLIFASAHAVPGGLCNVFDLFKVQPDNAKFKIGGPFPLHEEDCIFLKPETVQELVAVQWALTHWNQNPRNVETKLAMHAYDTCSRSEEVVRRTVEFLQNSGFYSPKECVSTTGPEKPKLLGLIAPQDRDSSTQLADFVRSLPIPVAAYSTPGIEGLKTKSLPYAFTTSPSVDQYLEASIHILHNLESDFVTLVGGPGTKLTDLEAILLESGVTVADKLSVSDSTTPDRLARSQSDVIISVLSKQELTIFLRNRKVLNMKKLLINIPKKGDIVNTEETRELLPKSGNIHLVILQRYLAELKEFRDYFLGVIKGNYEAYSLFASYMQQVYNCSLVGTPGFVRCKDLTTEYMASQFSQAHGVESAVLATYTLAEVGAYLSRDHGAMLDCEHYGPKCALRVMKIIESIDYRFSEFDPLVFDGYRLQYEKRAGYYSAKTVLIQGTHVVHDSKIGLMAQKVMDFATGSSPHIKMDKFYWPEGKQIKSQCSLSKSGCNPCPRKVEADLNRYSLSLPRNYDLYLGGMFDLHQGYSCQDQSADRQIYLPAAFIHTIWTVKQRYPQLDLLPNLEIGALVVDTCSNAKNAINTASQLEDSCVVLRYKTQNVTVTPENIVALVSDTKANNVESVFEQNMTPFLNLNKNINLDLQSYALVRLMQMLNWEYVSVVLSSTDPDVIAAFNKFQKVAKTHHICIAEVHKIPAKKAPVFATKVTVVFATPTDFAGLVAILPNDHGTVFLIVGEAHDWDVYASYSKNKLLGAVSLQSKYKVRSDFIDWFQSITPENFPERWFIKYIEETFYCAILPEHQNKYGGKLCSGTETLNSEHYGRMSKAAYMTDSLENFIFALDSVYKTLCPEKEGICEAFVIKGKRDIMRVMESVKKQGDDFEIYNYRLNQFGKPDYLKMGNWSQDDGLRITQNLVWYDLGHETHSPLFSTCTPPLCKCSLDKDFFTRPLFEHELIAIDSIPVPQTDVRTLHTEVPMQKVSMWRNKAMTWILLGATSLLLLAAVSVLVLVSVKLYMRVVKGNQSLGICLLCGVILLFCTTYFYILEPSDMVCKIRFMGHSMSYAVCFGVLIAKAIQLRNSESVGFNGYVSFWNYWLLLAFIVGVQFALDLQWMIASESVIINIFRGNPTAIRCNWSYNEFLLSQCYSIILLLLALFVALLNRNIKRNYKETKWLLSTTMICTPLWAVWLTAYALVPEMYKDTVIVLELLACATVILVFMFGPKVYILLSYEPVLVEMPPGYKIAGLSNNGTVDVFERDDFDDTTAARAISPSSSGGSTRSTTLSQADSNSLGGDQSPVFQAIVRKKSRSKRIKSQTQNYEVAAHMMPKPPYILSPIHVRPGYQTK